MQSSCVGTRALLVALGVSLLSAHAHADDTHYQDYVVGGRAVGLGGAYTAIADDPSGLFYNPAGLADARDTNLQVSTSLYGFERGSIEDRLTLPVPGVENLDIKFTDIIIVPASAGFVKSFGARDEHNRPYQSYGLSVLVPSFRSFSAAAGDDLKSYQRRVTDRELWTGVGYGRRVWGRLRLGASAYYVLRSVVDLEDVTVREPVLNGGEKFQIVSNDISFVSGALLFLVGAKYALTPRLSLGLSLQSPSVQLHSQTKLRLTRATSDPTATGGPVSSFEPIEITQARSQTRYAPAARFGVSWQEPYRYTLSADVSVHAPVDYTLLRVDDELRRFLPFNPDIEREAVVNVNVGGEVLIVREVSIAGGVWTDFSTARDIPRQPITDQPAKVDLLGVSMALGYFGEHTLSRLGVVYSFGSGHDVIPKGSDINRVVGGEQAFQRVRYFQSFFYVFVSSTFRY